jgi:predicted NBD/HSP70 family sugar kinase/antitoxin (DNA-binding transcriptional repressor) of toxin-antitoxin stability system
MRTASIRELSGDLITELTSRGENLGITNKGALAGVLIPLTKETVQRITHQDAAGLATSLRQAEAEMEAGERLTTLSELAADSATQGTRPGFSRVGIRELSGRRLEQAAQAGEALVVTNGRVMIALVIPVTPAWVERLIEGSIARFLGADMPEAPVLGNQMPSSVGDGRAMPHTPQGAPLAGTPVREAVVRDILHRRAIGIRIIADAPDERERLVGVVTDPLAHITAGPVELPLENIEEGHVFSQILTLVDRLRGEIEVGKHLIGVGLEIGGHVHQGRVVYSPNARWDHFPLADQLTESLGIPVVLENDANALAVHERWFHGIDADRFAVVLVTPLGIGCGLVIDGRVYRGGQGMAGELGHVPVEFGTSETVKCRCMNPGCAEGVATPRAIENTLPEYGFTEGYERALASSHLDSVKTVFELAGAGLGRAVSNVINLLNPEKIVFYEQTGLLGQPRTFHIESNAPASGVPRIYTGAMIAAMRKYAFSSGAENCQFIIRRLTDEHGARAAAASLIHQTTRARVFENAEPAAPHRSHDLRG